MGYYIFFFLLETNSAVIIQQLQIKYKYDKKKKKSITWVIIEEYKQSKIFLSLMKKI